VHTKKVGGGTIRVPVTYKKVGGGIIRVLVGTKKVGGGQLRIVRAPEQQIVDLDAD
jgi:hypothetical protein